MELVPVVPVGLYTNNNANIQERIEVNTTKCMFIENGYKNKECVKYNKFVFV